MGSLGSADSDELFRGPFSKGTAGWLIWVGDFQESEKVKAKSTKVWNPPRRINILWQGRRDFRFMILNLGEIMGSFCFTVRVTCR